MIRIKKQGALIVFSVLVFTACQTLKPIETATVKQTNRELYQSSIEESMSPAPSKVYSNLVPISKENKNLVWKTIDSVDYLLMLTWKQNVSYFKPYVDSAFYNTGRFPIWVTSAPQLLQTMKADTMQDVNMRLKQLLGLPPTSEYSYFVELWVNPADIFRPCPDKEINDKACDLCMPKDADSTHIAWINENRISRYYQCELYSSYPWSQLGYTYDWNANNTSHVGLSEFVIREHKNVKVKAIYTTKEYLGR